MWWFSGVKMLAFSNVKWRAESCYTRFAQLCWRRRRRSIKQTLQVVGYSAGICCTTYTVEHSCCEHDDGFCGKMQYTTHAQNTPHACDASRLTFRATTKYQSNIVLWNSSITLPFVELPLPIPDVVRWWRRWRWCRIQHYSHHPSHILNITHSYL